MSNSHRWLARTLQFGNIICQLCLRWTLVVMCQCQSKQPDDVANAKTKFSMNGQDCKLIVSPGDSNRPKRLTQKDCSLGWGEGGLVDSWVWTHVAHGSVQRPKSLGQHFLTGSAWLFNRLPLICFLHFFLWKMLQWAILMRSLAHCLSSHSSPPVSPPATPPPS